MTPILWMALGGAIAVPGAFGAFYLLIFFYVLKRGWHR